MFSFGVFSFSRWIFDSFWSDFGWQEHIRVNFSYAFDIGWASRSISQVDLRPGSELQEILKKVPGSNSNILVRKDDEKQIGFGCGPSGMKTPRKLKQWQQIGLLNLKNGPQAYEIGTSKFQTKVPNSKLVIWKRKVNQGLSQFFGIGWTNGWFGVALGTEE